MAEGPTPQIVSLQEHLKTKHKIRAILKGEEDTGKSCAAASFPGRKLWFDWDHKCESLEIAVNQGWADPFIDVFQPKSFPEAKRKLKSLKVQCPYDVIVWDSFTSMVEMELGRIAEFKAKEAETKKTIQAYDPSGKPVKNKSGEGRKIAGITVNSIEDYKAETAMIRDIINLSQEIDAHFLFICHVIVYPVEYARGTSKDKRQIFTGGIKASVILPARFPEVWLFEKSRSAQKGDMYVAHFHSTATDTARTTYRINGTIPFTGRSFYEELKPFLRRGIKKSVLAEHTSEGTQPNT